MTLTSGDLPMEVLFGMNAEADGDVVHVNPELWNEDNQLKERDSG